MKSADYPSIDKCDWSDPPKYIQAPRRWLSGAYTKIEDEYVGISLSPIYPFCIQAGEIFWLPSQTLAKLNSINIDFIYRKNDRLYRYVSKDERALAASISKQCPDCKGKGLYIGFYVVENCGKCSGKGFL